MTKPKFTPGPYKIDMSSRGFCHMIYDAEGQLVCTVEYMGKAEANAHLIAAAPELYAQCQRLSYVYKNEGHFTLAAEVEELLAKARGEG